MYRAPFAMWLVTAVSWILSCAGPASSTPMIEKALEELRNNPPVSSESFDFIILGDSRPAGALGQPEAFQTILREANVLRPTFVLDCGDLILGGAAEGLAPQWDEFEQVVAACEVPFIPVAGNHDISDAPTEKIWIERMGPTKFSFEVGNSLFIALNTEEVDALDRISDEQVEWLKGLLEGSDADHIFVFMHKPYFAQDWEENWSNVAEVLKGYPVRIVFGSDIHLYRNCGVRDGVQYIITGGGGAPIHTPEEEGGFHHYLLVRVRGDEVGWSVIRPGSVFPQDVVTDDQVKEIRSIRKSWVGTEPVEVPYGEGFDRAVKVLIQNPYETSFASHLTWAVPEGWSVSPMEAAYTAPPNATTELAFQIKADGPESVRFPAPSLQTVFERTKYSGPVRVDRQMDLIPTTVARRAPSPLAIDGELDDWEGSRPISVIYPHDFDPKNAEDLQSQIRFQWSPDFFYLAVETWDDDFYQPYAGDIVWLADNVELFLDSWSWGLSLTAAGPEVFLYWGVNRSRETVNTEVRLAVKRDERLTVYEAAFPQEVVLPMKLEAGNSCRFSLIMNDLDGSIPERPRHWLELTPGAGSGSGEFPRAKVILGE